MTNLYCLKDLKITIQQLKSKRDLKKQELFKKKEDFDFVQDNLKMLFRKRNLLMNIFKNHEKMKTDTEKMIIQSENVYKKLFSNSEKLYYNLKKITNDNN